MFITGSKIGGGIFPVKKTTDSNHEKEYIINLILQVDEYKFYKLPFYIPNTNLSSTEFCKAMEVECNKWRDNFVDLLEK